MARNHAGVARLDLDAAEDTPVAEEYPEIIDEPTTIDLDTPTDRWRYRCPNGHTTWEATNAHAWCPYCAEQAQNGSAVSPEFDFIVDEKREARIPWKHVRFEGSGRQRR